MSRRLVLALLATLTVLSGPVRSADAAIVDSFSDIPGAVFHNVLHPSPCSAHFHGFGSTSIIAYRNTNYDPDRFIAYDGPNGTGNVLGEVVSDNLVGIQVRRDFKGIHFPSPQIRSVRYPVEGFGFSIDGFALAVAGDALDVPETPGGASALMLGAATPSPFSGSTQIALSLPSSGRLRAEVFALDGRRVRTLADRDAEAGPIALVWDGQDEHGAVASPGVYLVRATHAGASATRRIVLAR